MRSRLGPRTPSSFMRNAMPAPSRDRKSLAGRPRHQAGKRKTGPPAPRSPGSAPGWSRYRNDPAVPRPSAPERGPALEPRVPLGQSVVSRTRQKSLLHMVRPTRPGCALGIRIRPTCPVRRGRERFRRNLLSCCGCLLGCDLACERQRPTRQITAIAQQVRLYCMRKAAFQDRNDPRVRGSAWAEPPQRLNHRSRRPVCPAHGAGPRMLEADRPSVDLDRPRGAVRCVADLRGHCVREAKSVRGFRPALSECRPAVRGPRQRCRDRLARASTSLNLGRS